MTQTKMTYIRIILAIAFAAALQAQPTAAIHNPGTFAVPRVIRYNNTFPGGAPTGAAGVIFSIYRDQYDGAPLWSEIQNVQAARDGSYSVLLGSTRNEGLPLDIFTAAEPRWLEVEINGLKEPRVRIGSVPYALVAGNAETLGGYPASAFMRVPENSSAPNTTASSVVLPGGPRPAVISGTQNYLAMFANATDLVNSAVYQTGNAVSIGGTTSLGAMTLIGNTPFGDAAGMALYNSGGGSGASVSLDMYNTSFNGGIPQAKIKALDDGNYSDHLTFWLKNPGSSTNPVVERMRITSSGSVGIGTTTPAAMLEVNGTVKVNGGITLAGNNNSAFNSIVFADGTTLSTGNIPATSSPSANLAAIAGLRWGYTLNSNFNTGNAPFGLAFDGANIWVTNSSSNNVSEIQASTGAVVGTFAVGTLPRGICFDGVNIWVANSGANTVTKLLASNGAVVGTYPAGSGPYGVAFDGTNIWVSNSTGNTVTQLLASSGATLASYPAGASPTGLAFDGLNIWVANSLGSTVTRLLASTGALIGTYTVGTNPRNIAFDGLNIWVTGGTLTKLSAANGATLGSYPIAGFGVAFDGTNIWVAQNATNAVTKILAATGATIGTYTVGTSPIGIAFDGSNMWVANSGTNNVTQIQPSAQ